MPPMKLLILSFYSELFKTSLGFNLFLNNNCQPNSCVNGTCINKINKYNCTCDAGYTGKNCSTIILQIFLKKLLNFKSYITTFI